MKSLTLMLTDATDIIYKDMHNPDLEPVQRRAAAFAVADLIIKIYDNPFLRNDILDIDGDDPDAR